MYLKVCGLNIKCDYESEALKPFEVAFTSKNFDLSFTKSERKFEFNSVSLVAKHLNFDVYEAADGWIYESFGGEQIWVNKLYSNAKLYIPNENNTAEVLLLIRIVIECKMSEKGFVSLHSACVEKDGQIFAFTGNSGVGKSTRAGQWIKSLGANWISGDRPSISVAEMKIYGVPWDGKEQIFTNVQAPIKAIFDVRRASSTWLRNLSKKQARRILMQQCFIPMWDEKTAIRVIDNIELLLNKLIKEKRIFRLFCDIDRKSAELGYDIIIKNKEEIFVEKNEIKIKSGFVLRNIVGEHMVMPVGENIATFEGAIVLNEVAAFIFEVLKNPVSEDDIVKMVLDKYEADETQVKEDVGKLLDTFRGYNILDE